jgi:circadian clock protein KaiC
MKAINKSKSGINGLDEITGGGLPEGRPTLVCGGPGCGKTLFASQFVVKGATLYKEPGVIITFEEKTEELTQNLASLGLDLDKLIAQKKLRVDYVHIDRHEIEETGAYDLEGLFIRLKHAIDTVGAKRVMLDTIENLFAGLSNEAIIRSELRRLFQWLKEQGVTAIITAEKGDGTLTRHGLEEYVSDCVILLDHRVNDQVSTRRLRIVKYRGTQHGTNEYPFLIDNDGISVMPVTSVSLDKKVSSERVSTGIESLDAMFGHKGFYKGTSILVSGTAGTGKTSIAAYFADACCKRGERCLYLSFEESPQQIVRNMKSIGLDLDRHVKKGLLKFHSSRPAMYGLEMHLASVYKLVKDFKPSATIIDPISNLITIGSMGEVSAMLMRMTDFLQNEGVTVLLTALTRGMSEQMDEGISSLVDTWLQVRDIELNGERNRGLYVMKSRGMSHSNQVREFLISSRGIELIDIYIGPSGILVGSAREAQKLHKLGGTELEAQLDREKIARLRQAGGKISTPAKQKK